MCTTCAEFLVTHSDVIPKSICEMRDIVEHEFRFIKLPWDLQRDLAKQHMLQANDLPVPFGTIMKDCDVEAVKAIIRAGVVDALDACQDNESLEKVLASAKLDGMNFACDRLRFYVVFIGSTNK